MAAPSPSKPVPSQQPAGKSTRTADDYLHQPEESIWQEYSGRSEFPLSFGTALVVHVILVLLAGLMVAGYIVIEEYRESPKVDNVIAVGGGGGSGADGGDPLAPKWKEDPAFYDKYKEANPSGLTVRPEDLQRMSEDELKRFIESAKSSNKAADKMFGLAEDARRKAGEPGQGGDGKGGGKGDGDGPGTGPGTGKGASSKELKRWILSISYSPGRDYLVKLTELELFVVVPGKNGTFLLYQDLLAVDPTPTELTEEQLKKKVEGRLYLYIDDKRNIRGLAKLLGFAEPSRVEFYLPLRSSLVDELRAKERSYKGKTTRQIEAEELHTDFELNRVNGKWMIEVINQYSAK